MTKGSLGTYLCVHVCDMIYDPQVATQKAQFFWWHVTIDSGTEVLFFCCCCGCFLVGVWLSTVAKVRFFCVSWMIHSWLKVWFSACVVTGDWQGRHVLYAGCKIKKKKKDGTRSCFLSWWFCPSAECTVGTQVWSIPWIMPSLCSMSLVHFLSRQTDTSEVCLVLQVYH